MSAESKEETPVAETTGRVMTRSRERKRKLDEGIPDDPPKPKYQTLGQYLMEEREKETQKLTTEVAEVSDYEQFQNYDKETVIRTFNATESHLLRNELYFADEAHDKVKIIFLTLQTGSDPKTFTHLCNNSSLVWNLKNLQIDSKQTLFRGLPSVAMLFVRGQYVEGTSLTSSSYKYLGLIGIQTVSSGSETGKNIYHECRFVFDYVLSRKEIDTNFGLNCLKCKKNKYGFALCGWK